MTIEPLHALLGTWELTGRSAGADVDDVFETMTGSLIIVGAWKPDPGQPARAGSDDTATMRRVD